MIAEIESNLGMFVDPPEENAQCHEVLDRLITLNDLFKVEHKEQLNQMIQQDIILQQHYVDIEARQIETEAKEAKVQECETAFDQYVQEQKADLKKHIQKQREILDQATKDSQLKLNTISNDVNAERQIIDIRLQAYDKKAK